MPVEGLLPALWCPYARPQNTAVTGPVTGTISGDTVALSSANRVDTNNKHRGAHCIGNKCMAWRWRKSSQSGEGFCSLLDDNVNIR